MAEKKITGIIWLVVGIIILVLSLVADSVGLGKNPGFGYKQVAGTIAGAIVFVVGLVMIQKNSLIENK